MASGDTLISFGPLGNEPPATNYATLDTRNGIPVLDFDAAANESAIFSGGLPSGYGGGGLTVDLFWTASSATTGNVVWEGAFEAGSGQDIDSDGFATGQTATGAANGTSGIETKTSIAFTSGAQMDSLVAGGRFRFRVSRLATDGSDTMIGDAELLYIVIRET